MYTPSYSREEDRLRILDFMRANEFISLVAHDGARPVASHLLVETLEHGQAVVINGHMSRANPLWRFFRDDAEVLLIFQGPHTYISPVWYNHLNVPTWNYQSVHAYGRPRLITGHEYQAVLSRLVARHEAASSYRLESLPADYVRKNIQGTVGFQVQVTRLEAAFKLSQNRDEQDYRNIILELEKRPDDLSQEIASAMRRNRPSEPGT
jgi:transcriptional regulator